MRGVCGRELFMDMIGFLMMGGLVDVMIICLRDLGIFYDYLGN